MMERMKQLRQMKGDLNDPHNSERITAHARVLAEIEAQQRAAVLDQREQLGIDPDDGVDEHDVEERVAEICDVLAAQTPGGPSLAEIWLAHHAPEDLDVDDPETLATYAEMDHSEWKQQVSRWADAVRHQADGLHGRSDREVADHHVSGQWGVSLDRFEQVIVEFDRERAMEELLAGPSEATEGAIYANTEALA
ncbi:hypothetical protein IL252_13705 [Halomicrobium sp. IBSBa]|uniref:hypothetical protein n=1 Tax=Halomicrobium sp. IBSBa TaxID=2778916 RepID=UPI001ABEFAA8|nr:hypothetical protein [Halomicrobium sp. IBSBa]MBO4248875.1 hypothetical protein [Halomicrobium sp. IBSBa]